MQLRLSERLQTIFDQLNPEQDVWDFCCDHGYLGGTAYKSRKFGDIYFVDQVDSIIEKLKFRFDQFVFSENNLSQAHFLCQSGESLKQKIKGSVSIAGVGGLTIYKILANLSKNSWLKADRLVLAPHRDDDKLLQLISADQNLKNYSLKKKETVREDNRHRHIYIFDLGS